MDLSGVNTRSPVTKPSKRILRLKSPRPQKFFKDPLVRDLKVTLKATQEVFRGKNTKKSRRILQKNLNRTFFSPSRRVNRNNPKSPARLAKTLIAKNKRKEASNNTTRASSDQDLAPKSVDLHLKEQLFWRNVHSTIIEYTQSKVDDAKMARFRPLTSPSRLMDKLTQVREKNSRRFLSTSPRPRRALLSPRRSREQESFNSDKEEVLNNFGKGL